MGKLTIRLIEVVLTVAATKGAEKAIEAILHSLKKK